MDHVQREMVTPAAPERVWAALTHSDLLSGWFGAEAEIDPRPGGRAAFRWADGRRRGAVVEAAEPGHLLVLRWLPFEHDEGGRVRQVPATEIRFTLLRHPRGTLVRVSEGTQVAEMSGVPS
jgi:uncharacterized protein YndB with AHSA1/START domain